MRIFTIIENYDFSEFYVLYFSSFMKKNGFQYLDEMNDKLEKYDCWVGKAGESWFIKFNNEEKYLQFIIAYG